MILLTQEKDGEPDKNHGTIGNGCYSHRDKAHHDEGALPVHEVVELPVAVELLPTARYRLRHRSLALYVCESELGQADLCSGITSAPMRNLSK